MAGRSAIDVSKVSWTFEPDSSIEAIKAGCLQRIATATELMAQNYTALIAERDKFKRWVDEEREINKNRYRESVRLARRIAALQGVITRMKKKSAL